MNGDLRYSDWELEVKEEGRRIRKRWTLVADFKYYRCNAMKYRILSYARTEVMQLQDYETNRKSQWRRESETIRDRKRELRRRK